MGQNFPVNVLADQHAKRYAYDGSNRLIYEGWALPKNQRKVVAGHWVIARYYYTGVSTNVDAIMFAGGDSVTLNKSWNDRASYTYA